MSLTDTHCHINHALFGDDCHDAIVRAREAGVKRLLVIGCDLASSRTAVDVAVAEPDVFAVVGVIPESAAEWNDDTRNELVSLRARGADKVVAWGEIGLDYYWDSVPREVQKRVFEAQIDVAKTLALPLVIHCRDAFADVLDILEAHGNPQAVLHCFTGTADEASRAVAAGFYIGVGGIATFKKSDALRDIIASVPLQQIVLETDAPYLAPQARRGKRNEPAFVAFVADAIAPYFNVTAEEFAIETTSNAVRLFGLTD